MQPSGVAVEVPHGSTKPPWELVGLLLAFGLLVFQVVPAMWLRSLWLDEAYTVAAIEDLRRAFSLTPGQMSIYYAGMSVWGKVSLAPWWLRLPSLLASLGALALVRVVARRIGGSRCAVVAPVLLAVSPMFVAKAVEARPYAMVELLVIACWYCFLRDRDDESENRGGSIVGGRWMWFLAVLATIGPGFHALFFIYVAPIGIVAVLARPAGARVLRVLPALVGCALSTLVLLAVSSGVQMGAFYTLPIIDGITEGFLSGLPRLAVVLGALVVLGAAPAVTEFPWSRRATQVIPTLWFAVPLGLAFVVRIVEQLYDPRYFAGIAPAVAILAGIGIVRVVDGLRRLTSNRIGSRWLAPTGLAITLLLAVVAVGGPRPASEWIENWDGATRFVADHTREGYCIAFAYKPFDVHQAFRAPFEASWNRLGDVPPLEPVSPTRQFGKVRHWEPLPTRAQLADLVSACQGLWVVGYHDSLPYDRRVSAVLEAGFDRSTIRQFQGEITVELYLHRPR